MRIRPTAEGWWFLLLILGVLMASLNTGNNLLYLLLALLLALLVVQNVLAEWHFRGLTVGRRLPSEAFAGEGAKGELWVMNNRRGLASFSILLEEEEDVGALAAVSWVGPGQQMHVPATYTFAARGPQKLSRIRLSSSFPFGLFMRRRSLDVPAEMLVYPSRRRGGAMAEPTAQGEESADPRRKGGNEELLGLRGYAPGDSLRRIHWPSSAKSGRLVVVERAQTRSEAVLVHLREGGDLEGNLARACGQADRHFQRGHAVGLRSPGLSIAPDHGTPHRRRLLTVLALYGGQE